MSERIDFFISHSHVDKNGRNGLLIFWSKKDIPLFGETVI